MREQPPGWAQLGPGWLAQGGARLCAPRSSEWGHSLSQWAPSSPALPAHPSGRLAEGPRPAPAATTPSGSKLVPSPVSWVADSSWGLAWAENPDEDGRVGICSAAALP